MPVLTTALDAASSTGEIADKDQSASHESDVDSSSSTQLWPMTSACQSPMVFRLSTANQDADAELCQCQLTVAKLNGCLEPVIITWGLRLTMWFPLGTRRSGGSGD